MGLAASTDDDLLFTHELDLFDRARRWPARQRDLDAESRTGMGDARDGILASRADNTQRLDDVGAVH